MSNRSDEPLVESVLAEATWLRGLALCLARDHDEAEDLVQETWMAAMRASPEPRASLRPWLGQVLRNLRSHRLRGSSRRRAREVGAALLQQGEAVGSTECLLTRLELQRTVADMVRELDEPYRTTLLLRFFEDRTPVEIAQAQGVPGGTVRWRLNEGIRRLRIRLDEAHGGSRDSWRAMLLPPIALPSAPGATTRRPGRADGFSAARIAWLAGGALVPALLAGLLLARPETNREHAANAAPASGKKEVRPQEVNDMNISSYKMRTLLGLVVPALVASADAAAAPGGPAAVGPPPACVPANNAAGCIELIPRSRLPRPVDAALERIRAGRKLDKLKIEPRLRKGNPIYVVKFEVGDLDEEFQFGPDGTFIESEIDVLVADLPAVVVATARAAVPRAPIEAAEFHNEGAVSFYELDDGQPRGPLHHRPARTFYELRVHAGSGKYKLKIAETGELLEKKLD
jgi:RNA polymerase sigma factor (sigma-70 family)